MSSTRWGQKWADVEEDDAAMSPGGAKTRFETEPDAQGIKTVIEYIERGGKSYKVTRKVKQRVVRTRMNLAVEARKDIAGFGKAAMKRQVRRSRGDDDEDEKGNDDPEEGGSRVTVSPEEVYIELVKKTGVISADTSGQSAEDKFFEESITACESLTKKTTSWTDALKIKKQEEATKEETGEKEGEEKKEGETGKGGGKDGGNRYVPPSLRGKDGKGDGKGRAQEETSLRVTNLSEDCRDGDLNDLFGQFGRLQRVFLGKHMDTGQCKGWAFVTYYNREDAEKARQKLHGHGYDNLILQVKWAEKRAE